MISIYEALVIADESPASELNIQLTMYLIGSILLALHLPIILIFTFDHKINTVGISRQPPLELQCRDIRNNVKLYPCKHSDKVESSTHPEGAGDKISESVFKAQPSLY